jgi:IS5 family transposase
MSSAPFQRNTSFNDWLIADHAALHALDDVEDLFDWPSLERTLSKLYPSAAGRPSHPILMLFRIVLLQHLYKITSDVQMESADGQPPSHDTISRFRRELAEHKLWENLLENINAQLKTKGIIIAAGQVSIMDATIMEAHQTQGETKDDEAGWCVKKNAKGKETATYGYKLHANCDEDGFIMNQRVTSGEVYDGSMRKKLLTGEESQLYADSVYDSKEGRADLAERGIENRVQRKGCQHKKLTQEDHDWNTQVGVMRAKIEHQFAEYKERYGLRRTRFMGLAMNAVHAGLAAIAHNLKKAARFYQLYGLTDAVTAE